MAPYTLRFYRRHDSGFALEQTLPWDDEVLPPAPCENSLVVVEDHHAKRHRIRNINASPLDVIRLRNHLLNIPAPIANFERQPTLAIPLSSGHIDEFLLIPQDEKSLLEWILPIRMRFRELTRQIAHARNFSEQLFDSLEESRAYLYGLEHFQTWHLCRRHGFQLVENTTVAWSTSKDSLLGFGFSDNIAKEKQ